MSQHPHPGRSEGGSKYLIQRLINVWAGIEQSAIDDDADQWRIRSMPAFEQKKMNIEMNIY